MDSLQDMLQPLCIFSTSATGAAKWTNFSTHRACQGEPVDVAKNARQDRNVAHAAGGAAKRGEVGGNFPDVTEGNGCSLPPRGRRYGTGVLPEMRQNIVLCDGPRCFWESSRDVIETADCDLVKQIRETAKGHLQSARSSMYKFGTNPSRGREDHFREDLIRKPFEDCPVSCVRGQHFGRPESSIKINFSIARVSLSARRSRRGG
ncbi:hypothetical protein C8R47DRAFT_1073260 [Mycena vitilis]|nr:hypothetical protein C8R47DRAFT_1073260 [Mycena vitilis]